MTEMTSDVAAMRAAMEDLHVPKLMPLAVGSSDEADVLLAPKGMAVHSVKPFLDAYRTAPERRVGTANLGDLASFIAHAVRFKDADSAVFAHRDEDKPSLTSVLDYHPAGEGNDRARFGKHRGHYAFPVSDQWRAWADVDGRPLGQVAFAEFLEEHIMDVVAPPSDGRTEVGATALDLVAAIGGRFGGPTEIMQASRGLRITESAHVQQAVTLSTGEVELSYRTEHRDDQGQPLKVPTLFLIGVPVFDGGAAYRVAVRLQYRRKEGSVIWTMRRYRPELTFYHAFDEAVATVRAEAGLPVFIGSPEA